MFLGTLRTSAIRSTVSPPSTMKPYESAGKHWAALGLEGGMKARGRRNLLE